jgi:hypothetical protein
MMPKRIINGEGIWRSMRLSRVEPPNYRAELANMLPLALANGVFEADPRLVWAQVYAVQIFPYRMWRRFWRSFSGSAYSDAGRMKTEKPGDIGMESIDQDCCRGRRA